MGPHMIKLESTPIEIKKFPEILHEIVQIIPICSFKEVNSLSEICCFFFHIVLIYFKIYLTIS